MKKVDESLYVQDKPNHARFRKSSRKKKPRRQWRFFKFLFALIEAFWMLIQIVQCLCGMFRK